MNPERWKLTGKRALVTGGTKGIGYAIAGELLALGAEVTITARTEETVTAVVAEWVAQGYNAHGVASDISTGEGRVKIVAALGQSLDILVNNVGTNIRKSTLDFSMDEYETVLNTNLAGAFALSRDMHPLLAASGDACIVNIGSVAGSVPMMSGLPYAASKAALDQLTRYLAVEWARDNIRVNGVNPWYTRTPLAAPRLQPGALLDAILAATPNRRIAEAEDVSAAVAFLCLPAARHITGQIIAVDGGFSVSRAGFIP